MKYITAQTSIIPVRGAGMQPSRGQMEYDAPNQADIPTGG
jgi:hypothetical protein